MPKKDFILYRNCDQKFKCKVLCMDGHTPNIKRERIPSNIHPADHYMVYMN